MDAMLERCAGLDVHQETVVACTLLGPLTAKPQHKIETFGTTTKELLRLHDWLLSQECTHVAMESTGVYWKPVWNLLEDSFTLLLANAQRIKNVPGRKTDVKDALWIAQLLRCGLIEPSFVPIEAFRDLRDLTRYRRKLVGHATSEKNRVHKILQDANIKLTTYLSDIFGVSGMKILNSLINGEVLDTASLTDMVAPKVRKKIPDLVEALNGRLRTHHRQMIDKHLRHLQYVESEIQQLETEIHAMLCPHKEEVEWLDTIPGISADAAASILAEIGIDMSIFPTEDHISSWAGVCPGNNESAGKKKGSRTRKANRGLKAVLCQCAKAAAKTKNTRLASLYRRVLQRRGEAKATIAVAHAILRIIYHMLIRRTEYEELGWDYLPKKEPRVDQWIRELQKKGYTIVVPNEIAM